jgi:germination protein M
MAKRRKKHSSGFLFMFIILAVLGIVIYFYKDKFLVFMNTSFNSGKDFVDNKVKKTDILSFFDKFFPKNKPNTSNLIKDKIILNEEKNSKETKKDDAERIDNNKTNQNTAEKKSNENRLPEKIVKNEKPQDENIQIKKITIDKKEDPKKETIQSKNTTTTEKPDNNIHSKNFMVYFSRIDKNDSLILTPVSRNIKYTDNPLTETLNTLLNGPDPIEKKTDIITNIPNNSKIISITIKNEIAYLNFTKEFEFNNFGRESTLNQLKQIVYTATEFSTVKKVQFMIEGKIKNYLGGEGVLIDKPLSRKDFS